MSPPGGKNGTRPPPTPKSTKQWDRPPPPAKGDRNPDSIFLQVGRALTYWEDVEERLARLFSILIGLDEPSAAGMRAFGAIATNRGRLEMLGAAAEVYFADNPDSALQVTFDSLLTATSGYAARRNEIAHGVVRWRRASSGRQEFFLFSPIYNTSKVDWREGSVYTYCSDDILGLAVRFIDLGMELDHFTWRFDARVAARKAYGGKLSPEQIETLDRLLLDPTGQKRRHLRQLKQALPQSLPPRRPRRTRRA